MLVQLISASKSGPKGQINMMEHVLAGWLFVKDHFDPHSYDVSAGWGCLIFDTMLMDTQGDAIYGRQGQVCLTQIQVGIFFPKYGFII